jgi:hypothetical protein
MRRSTVAALAAHRRTRATCGLTRRFICCTIVVAFSLTTLLAPTLVRDIASIASIASIADLHASCTSICAPTLLTVRATPSLWDPSVAVATHINPRRGEGSAGCGSRSRNLPVRLRLFESSLRARGTDHLSCCGEAFGQLVEHLQSFIEEHVGFGHDLHRLLILLPSKVQLGTLCDAS